MKAHLGLSYPNFLLNKAQQLSVFVLVVVISCLAALCQREIRFQSSFTNYLQNMLNPPCAFLIRFKYLLHEQRGA